MNLYEELPGLDSEHVELVLAVIAHAAGSHQHSGDLVPDPKGRYVSKERLRCWVWQGAVEHLASRDDAWR